MKSFLAALLVAGALLSALPATTAQNGMGISMGDQIIDEEIPFGGSATVNVPVTVGCLDVLQDGDITITGVDAPSWLTLNGSATAEPSAGCLSTSGSITVDVPLTLTVAEDAPGAEPQTLDITATMNGESATAALTFTVEYNPDYTITWDATFPLNVTGGQASFNVTVVQKSNARSMVMMENISVTPGTISGLASVVYEADALTKVFKITYKAPTGDWTNATARFTAYTHHLPLVGAAGDFMMPTDVTWTFVNGGSSSTPDGDGDDKGGKDTPAPAGALLALGLVALAAFARRR